jgi:hypothetical protein
MPEQTARPVPLIERERKFAAKTLYFLPMMTSAQRLGLDIVFNVSLWPVNLRVVPALVKSRHVQRKKPCPLYP